MTDIPPASDCVCGHTYARHLQPIGVTDPCAGGTPGFCGCTGYRPLPPGTAECPTAAREIPYMLENTRAEFERVRGLAWPAPAVPQVDDEPTATRHAMRTPVRQAAEVLSDAELSAALGAWYRTRENAPQVDEELRDEIARALSATDGGTLMAASWTSYLPDADAVLALPAVRRLFADAAAVQRVRELHRPWYTIHGVRHDHTVMANCEDYDACDGTADRDCDDAGEHERLACAECRHVFEDMDGNLFWPCPTIRALDGEAP